MTRQKFDTQIAKRSLRVYTCLLALITTSMVYGSINPNSFHSLEQLRAEIEHAANQLPEVKRLNNPTVSVNALDPRLRLKACSKPLEIEKTKASSSAGKVTLSVRCPDSPQWKIYVPLTIESEFSIVTLTTSLGRGDIVSAGDLQVAQIRKRGFPDPFLTKVEDAIGFSAKRALATGTELKHNMLATPLAIKRGEQTLITASGSGLKVQMNGKALQDGSAGDLIRVKNLSSDRVIQGEVQLDGTVNINQW